MDLVNSKGISKYRVKFLKIDVLKLWNLPLKNLPLKMIKLNLMNREGITWIWIFLFWIIKATNFGKIQKLRVNFRVSCPRQISHVYLLLSLAFDLGQDRVFVVHILIIMY